VSTVFYDHFERHSHGEGLKGHATHYCPGCGHGLAHKYLAEAIEELGVQDRTVAVSPVGCSVFLYYYFDVGNSQAAHGRAPAVGIGHKVANPDSIVICYQGDGDLASIGLAEIVGAAQSGIPMTVIFINNAIYGMTGGQMAPTTLMGQKSSTSPTGRGPFQGQPMKVAELMAQLDGTIYIERVALFDNKQRMRAKKAIKKALKLQVDNKGFALVEVLAECPTHLGLDPLATEKWVKESMLPVFPLGVKKDLDPEPRPAMALPSFEPDRVMQVVEGSTEAVPRFCKGFPSQVAQHDISLKLAGAGGDGAQTAAMLITRAAINEGFDSTHIPSYGPESRGGTSYADVHVAEGEVLSQRSEPGQVRSHGAPRRDCPVRQLGDRRGPGPRVGHQVPGNPLHPDRVGPGQGPGEERRRSGRAAGGHGPVPCRDVPDRDPPGAQGQVRDDPAQRAGLRPGRPGRRRRQVAAATAAGACGPRRGGRRGSRGGRRRSAPRPAPGGSCRTETRRHAR